MGCDHCGHMHLRAHKETHEQLSAQSNGSSNPLTKAPPDRLQCQCSDGFGCDHCDQLHFTTLKKHMLRCQSQVFSNAGCLKLVANALL